MVVETMAVGIDPKVDYAFKRVFGRDVALNRGLLISLLNAVLRLPAEKQIVSVQVVNPLREIKKHDLHNKLGLICVMPVRVKENWWYTVALRPTPADLRGEKYFLEVLIPFVEKQYPAKAEAKSRLLLGFSLLGVVAFSMVFRHPDVFGRAAAFDLLSVDLRQGDLRLGTDARIGIVQQRFDGGLGIPGIGAEAPKT